MNFPTSCTGSVTVDGYGRRDGRSDDNMRIFMKVGNGLRTNIPGIVKQNLFMVFVHVCSFNHPQSTPLVTGCNDPNTAPTVGNIV